ncbi:hypothetical protein BAUCODRAFT_51792, partial [Baudoinia panamericana UAMH 10762]
MAAAADKARFYLEQHVPTLQTYSRLSLFTRAEIAAITSKRSTFEHIINSRGGSTPADFARYAEYEINLNALLKHRCRRLGIKDRRLAYDGKKNVFFILERGTKKFPGDMGLWMQYIDFCKREKANKKLVKVFTAVLRLKPREWGLWVLAAKWFAEEQMDMQNARGYLQRGLRFCKDEVRLWLEYVKLEMVYLAKVAARRKILGLDEKMAGDAAEVEEDAVAKADGDEDMIALPTITAAEFEPEPSRGTDAVDLEALQKLAQAPVFSGAIPIAIFDAAMKQFNNSAQMAEQIFELVAAFDQTPASSTVLEHILSHLRSTSPSSSEAIMCEARLSIFGTDMLSPDFPAALGTSLS